MHCDRIIKVMKISSYLAKLENLKGKEIIVTGGTSGIGLSIVKHLLNKNADVVIMARNLNKAEEVKANLLKLHPDCHLSIIKYDQSNKKLIQEAANLIIEKHPHFYALILNAGIFQSRKTISYVDDIPQTINTNFVGLALLLKLLLERTNNHHRYILQGSFVAGWRQKKICSLKVNNVSAFQQYIISKSGVEALFFHYYKEQCKNASFYLVEPGLTSTDIIRDFPSPIRQMGRVFLKVVSHSPNKAALTAMLALQEDLPNGSYIVPRGLFTYMGFPKVRPFPKKREREHLYSLLTAVI